MNITITRSFFTLLFIVAITASTASAQSGIGPIIKAGDNAEKMMKSYMEPLIVGLGYGMSNSWFNTAKPHNSLGFDLTLTVNVAFVPSSRRFYTFRNADYVSPNSFIEIYEPTGAEEVQVPTVMGPDETDVRFNYSMTDPETGVTVNGVFDAVPGIGMKEYVRFDAIPSPMIQLGFGVVKNTDVIVRFVPKMKVGEYQFNMLGFGVKHDVKQWIPGMKHLPFDLSVLFAYSMLDNEYSMTKLEVEGENQKGKFEVNNFTSQLLISKKLSVVTFYGSLGYNHVGSSMKLQGTYIVDGVDGQGQPTDVVVKDPIDFSFTNSSMKATLGMRLKLGFFTLHGDYSFQEYNVFAFGMGLAFR